MWRIFWSISYADHELNIFLKYIRYSEECISLYVHISVSPHVPIWAWTLPSLHMVPGCMTACLYLYTLPEVTQESRWDTVFSGYFLTLEFSTSRGKEMGFTLHKQKTSKTFPIVDHGLFILQHLKSLTLKYICCFVRLSSFALIRFETNFWSSGFVCNQYGLIKIMAL